MNDFDEYYMDCRMKDMEKDSNIIIQAFGGILLMTLILVIIMLASIIVGDETINGILIQL